MLVLVALLGGGKGAFPFCPLHSLIFCGAIKGTSLGTSKQNLRKEEKK